MMPLFRNRIDAGTQLASQLSHYSNCANILVIGLPRGGVPVAYQVAKALNAPLDICLVRKLGVPGCRELAMGAISSGGVMLLNEEVVADLDISAQTIDQVKTQELRELNRQDNLYRGTRPSPIIHDQILILVDDGIATGATHRAAIAFLQQQQPESIVVAAPVIEPETYQSIKNEVTEVKCLIKPTPFYCIAFWYEDFSQTTDAEVQKLLML